jgi:integrase
MVAICREADESEVEMTKLHLKYVQSFGGYHYFRRRGWPRIPLPGVVGSAEFMAAYQQALAAAPVTIGASKRSKPGSVSAAIAGFYDSRAFRSLTGGTPASRRSILEKFRDRAGHLPLSSLPKEFVVALLDTMPPHVARNWLKALRHFTTWCVERKLMRSDPTLGIRLKMPKSDGFHTWTEDEISAFERRWPVGSKPRLALALGLFTAQRRADVVRIGRQHIKDNTLTVRQTKTGASLGIPLHPELARIIAATPTVGQHLTLLVTKTGRSYSANKFSDQFRSWCDAAGLPPRCSFHGLRKSACTRLAEAGCTVHEIAAVSGHRSLKEVTRYTEKADQRRLARAALERIANKSVKPGPGEVSKPLTSLAKTAEG